MMRAVPLSLHTALLQLPEVCSRHHQEELGHQVCVKDTIEVENIVRADWRCLENSGLLLLLWATIAFHRRPGEKECSDRLSRHRANPRIAFARSERLHQIILLR